jgi:hypothetical protein
MVLKAWTVEMNKEMNQVDSPKTAKSPTVSARTLTIVLMIYGPYMERKPRVMMKPE